MMLHSIASAQQVFPQESGGEMSQRTVKGGVLMYRQDKSGYVLERLISTDPAMYLDGRYRPGMRDSGDRGR